MPTKLYSLGVAAPGFAGLNKQQAGSLMEPIWATVLTNCVFDDNGRIASRKGYKNVNATAISTSPNVKSIHEYIDGAGNSVIILAAGNIIYKVVGTSLTDISGTITTPTADNWKFINFNKVCVGMQVGHTPIVMATTGGSFADITLTGTDQPADATTTDMVGAFGRVWAIDGTDLFYSNALDHTAWNAGFDLTTVWLNGMDEGVAVAEFNGHLVVFGKRTVIVFNNPWNPTGGGTFTLSQMSLVENIDGVGCVARDSIQHIGNDIIYLSNSGLVSLSRTIQEKSMPSTDLSKNNRDYLLNLLANETASDIKSVYSKKEGFYLVSFPSQEKLLCIDLRTKLPDNTYRFLEWDSTYYSFMNSQDNVVYIGTAGYINKYKEYLDGIATDDTGGFTYLMRYDGPWNEVHEEIKNRLKITKYISTVVVGANDQTITLKWAVDYSTSFNSVNITLPTQTIAEWGISEWAIGEYGVGATLFSKRKPTSKVGRVIKFGFQTTINAREVSLQELSIMIKVGKQVI